MPTDDKTALIIASLNRLEQKADRDEGRFASLLTDVAGMKAQISAMEKAENREIARQSEDRGGARAWLGTAGAWLLAIVSMAITLTHKK